MPQEGSREAHEQVALEVRTKTGKWVSIEDNPPLVAVNTAGEGWGWSTANFFDFSGGKPPEEFMLALANLTAIIEKCGRLKRPYRIILIAGPVPKAELP